MIFFDTEEFENRVIHIIGDAVLAEKVVAIKTMYEFIIGIVGAGDIETYFDDENAYSVFLEKNHLKNSMNSRFFDESELGKVLINELNLTQKQVDLFFECERSYLEEIGAM